MFDNLVAFVDDVDVIIDDDDDDDFDDGDDDCESIIGSNVVSVMSHSPRHLNSSPPWWLKQLPTRSRMEKTFAAHWTI